MPPTTYIASSLGLGDVEYRLVFVYIQFRPVAAGDRLSQHYAAVAFFVVLNGISIRVTAKRR